MKKRVIVGIYWVVGGKIILHRELKIKSISDKSEIKIIDCTFSHFGKWTAHQNSYPSADFATYPRGRVMYDTAKNEHVIFADMCVLNEQIEEIAKLCNAKSYRVERDEHYRCDKCMQNEEE